MLTMFGMEPVLSGEFRKRWPLLTLAAGITMSVTGFAFTNIGYPDIAFLTLPLTAALFGVTVAWVAGLGRRGALATAMLFAAFSGLVVFFMLRV